MNNHAIVSPLLNLIGSDVWPSFVYFIRCGEFVKIGVSKNVQTRLSGLQSCCPYDLELLCITDGGKPKEMAYHERYRDLRARGEWYVLHDRIKADIAALNAANSFEAEPVAQQARASRHQVRRTNGQRIIEPPATTVQAEHSRVSPLKHMIDAQPGKKRVLVRL